MNRGVRVSRVSLRASQTSLFSAVRDGSWDVVQLKVRRAHDDAARSTTNCVPQTSSTPNARARSPPALPPSTLSHRPKLTNIATTTAISTAVAAVVSTALLLLSFLLVVTFRFVFVPGGPSTTHQELVFDFTAPSPVAVASFLSPATLAAMPSDPARVTTEMMRGARLLSSGRDRRQRRPRRPETPHNADAGLFQVRAELLDARGDAVANATRPASLRYASREVRWIRLLTRWPLTRWASRRRRRR